jgi:hypothetical protein
VARFDLWPRPYRARGFAGAVMRVSEDLRRTVVFLGYGNSKDFQAVGTGFLLGYKDCRYLVTAEHVAMQLSDAPFCIRINHKNGAAIAVHVDPDLHGEQFKWHTLPAENGTEADIAVVTFCIDLARAGCDYAVLPGDKLLDDERLKATQIGVGDLCYAIGLFRLHAGKDRNLPIVHSGNIAMMAGEDPIPVSDWRNPSARTPLLVDAHLVEMASLEGLSGSPVMVRPTVDLVTPQENFGGPESHHSPLLLGLWQSAWAGDPSIELRRDGQKVPVGIGAVAPSSKLLKLLETEAVVKEREDYHVRAAAMRAAKVDST